MATSYANPCGSGDRRTLVFLTPNASILGGGAANTVLDGATSTNAWFFQAPTTGNILEFWFPSAKIIDEVKWYQQTTAAHGTWKWQGSNDRTTWTDIGGTFTLGGVTTQTITTLAGNTTPYIFYQLFQVSGNTSGSPWIFEIEFKIDDGGTATYLHAQGSGNRTATITVTASGISWTVGTPANLVNGTAASDLYWDNAAAAGNWIQFDFGSAVVVQQARFLLGSTSAQGDWKLQGSANASTWTDLTAAVTLGTAGATGGPFYTCFIPSPVNTTAYRYHRFLGVAGNRTSSPYEQEVEFMIGAPASGGGGGAAERVTTAILLPV